MTTIIEQAVKGQRKAMEQLYEANKQKVFFVSSLLLGNEAEAAEAAAFAFKNVWDGMTANGVQSEDDFRHLAIRKAADYCKRKVMKETPKAFRLPHCRNFLISGDKSLVDSGENIYTEILNLLPPLQRFILVLHSVGEYTYEQIAVMFKFDIKTVGLALDAERTNIERIIRHLDENKNTYEWVLETICDEEENAKIPTCLDERSYAVIDGIAKPIEKKKKKKQITIIGTIALAVCMLAFGIIVFATRDAANTTSTNSDDTSDTSDDSIISEPIIDLDETLTYYADIEIADYGTVTVELNQSEAPVTVSNFVNLAQNGFYDGLTFHRIAEDFVIQGGDPNGDGTGGSDNCIVGEFTDNGYENCLSHTRGAISMARSTDYNSASSQFFIVHEDSTELDGQYAVFGYVTEGMEVVDAICEAAEPTDDDGTIPADAQPIITSVTIRTE